MRRRVISRRKNEERITKTDLPFTVLMILLDIAAPIFLLPGLSYTTAANASLLNNFEIVATALIALMIFRELPPYTYFIALGLMLVGAWLCSSDEPIF